MIQPTTARQASTSRWNLSDSCSLFGLATDSDLRNGDSGLTDGKKQAPQPLVIIDSVLWYAAALKLKAGMASACRLNREGTREGVEEANAPN